MVRPGGKSRDLLFHKYLSVDVLGSKPDHRVCVIYTGVCLCEGGETGYLLNRVGSDPYLVPVAPGWNASNSLLGEEVSTTEGQFRERGCVERAECVRVGGSSVVLLIPGNSPLQGFLGRIWGILPQPGVKR